MPFFRICGGPGLLVALVLVVPIEPLGTGEGVKRPLEARTARDLNRQVQDALVRVGLR
jgi:hypothetical protein